VQQPDISVFVIFFRTSERKFGISFTTNGGKKFILQYLWNYSIDFSDLCTKIWIFFPLKKKKKFDKNGDVWLLHSRLQFKDRESNLFLDHSLVPIFHRREEHTDEILFDIADAKIIIILVPLNTVNLQNNIIIGVLKFD